MFICIILDGLPKTKESEVFPVVDTDVVYQLFILIFFLIGKI